MKLYRKTLEYTKELKVDNIVHDENQLFEGKMFEGDRFNVRYKSN